MLCNALRRRDQKKTLSIQNSVKELVEVVIDVLGTVVKIGATLQKEQAGRLTKLLLKFKEPFA